MVLQKLLTHRSVALTSLALVTAETVLVFNAVHEEFAILARARLALLALVGVLVLPGLALVAAHTLEVHIGVLGQDAPLSHALSHASHVDRVVRAKVGAGKTAAQPTI